MKKLAYSVAIALIVASMVISVAPTTARPSRPPHYLKSGTLYAYTLGGEASATVVYVASAYRNNYVKISYKVTQYDNADAVVIVLGIYEGDTVLIDPDTGQDFGGVVSSDFWPYPILCYEYGVMGLWKHKYFYDQNSNIKLYDIKVQSVVWLSIFSGSDWKIYQWWL